MSGFKRGNAIDNAQAYRTKRTQDLTEQFDEAQGRFDYQWETWLGRDDVDEETALEGTKLLDLIGQAISQCRSVKDVHQLRESLETAHNLAGNPELVELTNAAASLEPADQSRLVRTVRHLSSGDMFQARDGRILAASRGVSSGSSGSQNRSGDNAPQGRQSGSSDQDDSEGGGQQQAQEPEQQSQPAPQPAAQQQGGNRPQQGSVVTIDPTQPIPGPQPSTTPQGQPAPQQPQPQSGQSGQQQGRRPAPPSQGGQQSQQGQQASTPGRLARVRQAVRGE